MSKTQNDKKFGKDIKTIMVVETSLHSETTIIFFIFADDEYPDGAVPGQRQPQAHPSPALNYNNSCGIPRVCQLLGSIHSECPSQGWIFTPGPLDFWYY